MKRTSLVAAAVAIGFTASAAFATSAASAASAATSGDAALAKFAAAWAKVTTYTCTIQAHEVLGSRVQDRTYTLRFRKPYDTKVNLTAGDGRGSAVVWNGGDTVYGHKGGFLAMFKRHLALADPQATSIRGTTVAEANFGALYDHIKALKGATIDAAADGSATKIKIAVADPSSVQGVTKELMVLGANDLPVEFDQWAGSTLVKRVSYSDVVLNPKLSDADFKL